MPSAEVGDLHSPVTQVECRRDRYLHVRLPSSSRVHAQPLCVGCGFGGGESDVTDSWAIRGTSAKAASPNAWS